MRTLLIAEETTTTLIIAVVAALMPTDHDQGDHWNFSVFFSHVTHSTYREW